MLYFGNAQQNKVQICWYYHELFQLNNSLNNTGIFRKYNIVERGFLKRSKIYIRRGDLTVLHLEEELSNKNLTWLPG